MSIKLADVLKYLNSGRGVIKEVSEETGISTYSLYNWKEGKGKPSGDDMLKLVDMLKSKFGNQPPGGYLRVDDSLTLHDSDEQYSSSKAPGHPLSPALLQIAASLQELAASLQRIESKIDRAAFEGSGKHQSEEAMDQVRRDIAAGKGIAGKAKQTS